MKVAVINDIHVGKCLVHNGKIRASSHLVEERLEMYLKRIIQQHSPDLLINLGDLIRSEDRDADLKKYKRLISCFKQVKLPVIHLLGNQELKKLTKEDIQNIWHENGFYQNSYGSIKLNKLTLIWLGLQINISAEKVFTLPKTELEWLKIKLRETSSPTIIFTHCPIDDHNVDGNFFYEALDNRKKNLLFFENQEEIRSIITSSGCVIAVIQAHLHYFHTNVLDTIPYITCPAMADNVCGPYVDENLPDIYTIMTADNNKITVKAYSSEYCYAGYEGSY